MKLHQALPERKHNIQQDHSLLKKIVANSFKIIGEGELSKPSYLSEAKSPTPELPLELQATMFRMFRTCKIGE